MSIPGVKTKLASSFRVKLMSDRALPKSCGHKGYRFTGESAILKKANSPMGTLSRLTQEEFEDRVVLRIRQSLVKLIEVAKEESCGRGSHSTIAFCQ